MASRRFQLLLGARPGSGGSGGVGWRLLGANNRELGRSAAVYVDAEAALESLSRLRNLTGVAHIVQQPQTGLWAWRLQDEDVLVAHSGRGFRRERECRYNLEQFRDAVASAPVSVATVRSESSARRAQLPPTPPEEGS